MDHKPFPRSTAKAIATELMDIQMGSAEDAKNLLDSTLDPIERSLICEEIDKIAAQHQADLNDLGDNPHFFVSGVWQDPK